MANDSEMPIDEPVLLINLAFGNMSLDDVVADDPKASALEKVKALTRDQFDLFSAITTEVPLEEGVKKEEIAPNHPHFHVTATKICRLKTFAVYWNCRNWVDNQLATLTQLYAKYPFILKELTAVRAEGQGLMFLFKIEYLRRYNSRRVGLPPPSFPDTHYVFLSKEQAQLPELRGLEYNLMALVAEHFRDKCEYIMDKDAMLNLQALGFSAMAWSELKDITTQDEKNRPRSQKKTSGAFGDKIRQNLTNDLKHAEGRIDRLLKKITKGTKTLQKGEKEGIRMKPVPIEVQRRPEAVTNAQLKAEVSELKLQLGQYEAAFQKLKRDIREVVEMFAHE